MMETINSVRTAIGEIYGRDAIRLDGVSQEALTLTFKGVIDGRACRGSIVRKTWLDYQVKFLGVLAYDCREVDVCRWHAISSFDEMENSEWLRELRLGGRAQELRLGEIHHYTFSTYDLIFRIAASRFELEILDERSMVQTKGG